MSQLDHEYSGTEALDKLLRHTVKNAPMVGPPAGFAAAMERRVKMEDQSAWESRLIWALGAVSVVMLVWFSDLWLPGLPRLSELMSINPPLPLLLVSGACLLAIYVIDHWIVGEGSGRH